MFKPDGTVKLHAAVLNDFFFFIKVAKMENNVVRPYSSYEETLLS